MTDDLLPRDIFPNFMSLRTTSPPESLQTEIEVFAGRAGSKFKEHQHRHFSLSLPQPQSFSHHSFKSEDKIRDTCCLRVRINLPTLKTAIGKILSIFLWLKFCDSSPNKRGSRDGHDIISAWDLCGNRYHYPVGPGRRDKSKRRDVGKMPNQKLEQIIVSPVPISLK